MIIKTPHPSPLLVERGEEDHSAPFGFSAGSVAIVSKWLVLVIGLWFGAFSVSAEELSFTNLLAQGDAAEKRGDVSAALKSYASAEAGDTNCADLCVVTKRICDLMYDKVPAAVQKSLAEQALACALQAEAADPKNATAHLCVAVCYVKNFPYTNNATKINWSKAMKAECETAIALDPKQDISYYLLGRWHFSTANLGFVTRELLKVVYGGLPKASNEDAIKNFKLAIELNPGRIIHHASLAEVYEATGQTDLEKAELQACAKLTPQDRDDADAQKEAAKKLGEMK
jgi:hypothetical protein